MTKNKKIYWSIVVSVLALSEKAFAGDAVTNTTASIPNPLGTKNNTLIAFITLLLDTIFPIASLFSIFMMIYAGFLMVTAGGNEEKLKDARQAFLWTVIGIAILLGAKVLSAVICGTVNQLSSMKLSCN